MEEALIVIACLVINFLLAAYEMAFVSSPRSELRKLGRAGSQDAQRISKLRESPERTLSVIQVGITLVGAISAAVGGVGALQSIEPLIARSLDIGPSGAKTLAIAMVVVPLTYLSVVIGELVPKSLALRNPVRIALAGSKPLLWTEKIFSPMVSLLEWSTRAVLKIFFPSAHARSQAQEGLPESALHKPRPQQLVQSFKLLDRRKTQDVMVPWRFVETLSVDAPLKDATTHALKGKHTRLPVIQRHGGEQEVKGIINTKEMALLSGSAPENWHPLIRPVLKVHADQSALRTLRVLYAKRAHLALVYSKGPTPDGIVTFEDLADEVWSEVFSEPTDEIGQAERDSKIHHLFAER